MRLAVVDLGSNSFQVFVADAGPAGDVNRVLVERDMLYLGDAVGRHGVISEGDQRRAVASAERLLGAGLDAGPDRVLVVATSALRDARNGSEVVAAIEGQIGVPVRVLSGEEEARLAYRGARAGLPGGVPLVVVDLGGGSLEVAAGSWPEPDWAVSVPAGVSRLAAEADVGEVVDARAAKRLRRMVRNRLDAVRLRASTLSGHRAVLAGGSGRAVARVILADPDNGGADGNVHGSEISTGQVRAVARDLVGRTLDERLGLPGASNRRALHLPVSAIIVAEVARALGAQLLVVSEWSLRHGLILEAMAATRLVLAAG